MTEELKPCPFCGKEANVVLGESCNRQNDKLISTVIFYVACSVCFARSDGVVCEFEHLIKFALKDAIQAWNKRYGND